MKSNYRKKELNRTRKVVSYRIWTNVSQSAQSLYIMLDLSDKPYLEETKSLNVFHSDTLCTHAMLRHHQRLFFL